MKTMLSFLVEFTGTVFAAEFAAGFIHWFEDAYIRESTPVIGKWIGRPNVVHHHYPRHMTRNSWWQSSWDLVLISTVLLAAAGSVGLLTWQVWLFALLAANANEFHKWAHRTRKENGRVISFLQDMKILQTAKHHALHHTDPKNSHYCTITNVLNPVLDTVRFWDGLERLLAKTTGIKRQPDTSVRGHGPGPAWLSEFGNKPVRA
jgi:ubiquitin-conjugating enzyme E2 variant